VYASISAISSHKKIRELELKNKELRESLEVFSGYFATICISRKELEGCATVNQKLKDNLDKCQLNLKKRNKCKR
jgi:uncharacterized membrane protein